MLIPKLIRAAWYFIGAGLFLILLDVVVFTILVPGFGILKNHRGLRLLINLMPWVFPLACWALFSWAARHDRIVEQELRAHGIAAAATIVEVRDQSIDVGVNPVLFVRLRVTPADAEPFDTELGIVPSRLEMGSVREGMTLRVRYDPKDRNRISVESVTSVTVP